MSSFSHFNIEQIYVKKEKDCESTEKNNSPSKVNTISIMI